METKVAQDSITDATEKTSQQSEEAEIVNNRTRIVADLNEIAGEDIFDGTELERLKASVPGID